MLRLTFFLLAFQDLIYDPSIAPSHHSASPNKNAAAFLRWRVAGTYSLRIQSPASQDFHLDYACGNPLIWSPSGTRLLAYRATTEHVHANDCQPAIYGIPTRKRIQTFGKPGTTFALSPNQKNLAYADATELWIQPLTPDFNLSTPAWRLAQHSLGIDELRWTPDSQRLHFKIPFDDHAAPQIIEVAPGAIPQASGPREPTIEERLPLLALDLRAEAPHPKPYRLPLPPTAIPRRYNYFIGSHQHSPDGQWLAYGLRSRYSNTGEQALYAIPARGGTPKKLSAANHSFLDFQWSADSLHLLACNPTHSLAGPGLYQIRVTDGLTKKLTTNPCDAAHDPRTGFHLYYWERHQPFLHRIPRSGGPVELYLTTKDRVIAAHANALFFEQKDAPTLTILRRDLRTHQTTIWYTRKLPHPIKSHRQSGHRLLLFGTDSAPHP